MVNGKRARHLRKEKARRERQRTDALRVAAGLSGAPVARFVCECGAKVEVPGGTTTVRHDVRINGQPADQVRLDAAMSCPNCGRQLVAANQVVHREKGLIVHGFADTEEQYAAIRELIAQIHAMDGEPTVAEVAQALEDAGPEYKPIANWIRENSAVLGLGTSVVAIVIALLTWLYPMPSQSETPTRPTGISQHDLERLAREIATARAQQSEPAPTSGDAQGNQQARHRAMTGGEGEHK